MLHERIKMQTSSTAGAIKMFFSSKNLPHIMGKIQKYVSEAPPEDLANHRHLNKEYKRKQYTENVERKQAEKYARERSTKNSINFLNILGMLFSIVVAFYGLLNYDVSQSELKSLSFT
jgi:hypothetical protein